MRNESESFPSTWRDHSGEEIDLDERLKRKSFFIIATRRCFHHALRVTCWGATAEGKFVIGQSDGGTFTSL